MKRIIIYVEGGMVQEVVSSNPDVDVRVLDMDNQPESEGELEDRNELEQDFYALRDAGGTIL
jgi:hypothetical protein